MIVDAAPEWAQLPLELLGLDWGTEVVADMISEADTLTQLASVLEPVSGDIGATNDVVSTATLGTPTDTFTRWMSDPENGLVPGLSNLRTGALLGAAGLLAYAAYVTVRRLYLLHAAATVVAASGGGFLSSFLVVSIRAVFRNVLETIASAVARLRELFRIARRRLGSLHVPREPAVAGHPSLPPSKVDIKFRPKGGDEPEDWRDRGDPRDSKNSDKHKVGTCPAGGDHDLVGKRDADGQYWECRKCPYTIM